MLANDIQQLFWRDVWVAAAKNNANPVQAAPVPAVVSINP